MVIFPVQWALQLAIFGVLVLTMLGPIMTMSGDQLSGGGNVLRQLLYFSGAVLAAAGVRALDTPRRLLAMPWPIALTLGYCALTLAWSGVPGIGARRLMLTVLATWTICVAVRFVPFHRTVNLLRIVLGAAVILNIAVVLLFPDLGVHQAADVLDKNLIGDWRGFMMQKNITGAATGFAIIFFVFGGGRLSVWVRGFFIALCLYLLWNTGSRTSLGMTAGALAVGTLFLFYSARFRVPVIVLTIVTITLIASLTNVFRFDKSPDFSDRKTLSGRMDIWEAVLHYLETHHWVGAGYGSFWDVGPASPIYQYGKGWVTDLAQGHNGYLDLLATVGVPGLCVVLFGYVIWPLVKLLGARSAQGARGALIISIITFCVGHNATESTLMDRDNIPQILLTFAIALLYNLPLPSMRPLSRLVFEDSPPDTVGELPDQPMIDAGTGGQPT